MTWFKAILDNRTSIEDNYFKAIESAQENAEKEFLAAETIRRAWRNYKKRIFNKKQNEAALIIQNTWRMHRAVGYVRILRAEKYRDEREKYFNLMASKIQKVWRGYYDRKHIFDFSKQRQYINSVAEKNSEMMRMLDNYYAETNEEEKRVQFDNEVRIQEKKALKQHHLISTSAIPSIFQPPACSKDVDDLPPVENFIKTVNKARIFKPSRH